MLHKPIEAAEPDIGPGRAGAGAQPPPAATWTRLDADRLRCAPLFRHELIPPSPPT
ncbi:MAG: hypothetical protein MZW92_15550 [Comamonadaceae bacterium]|nr:hypothetical protein [Comamonadaceae bacterium]